MLTDNYNNILLKRIGYDCVYRSMSCSLSYANLLYNALLYCFNYFIYNRKTFTNNKLDKDPGEYLLENNRLLFIDINLPESEYKKDMREALKNLISLVSETGYEDFINKYTHSVDTNGMLDVKNITEYYLCKSECISVLVDIFYLDDYSNYYKVFNAHKRHQKHYVNLFGISDNQCSIIDADLLIRGFVSLENLLKAHNSVASPDYFTLNLNEFRKNDIDLVLKSNLLKSLEDHTVINGKDYMINGAALKQFAIDLPEIIEELYIVYGMYTPQFLTHPWRDVRTMIIGHSNVIKHMYENNNMPFLKDIAYKLEEYYNAWLIFNTKIDKIYLQNEDVRMHISDLIILLNKIITCNDEVMEETNKVVCKLPVS